MHKDWANHVASYVLNFTVGLTPIEAKFIYIYIYIIEGRH